MHRQFTTEDRPKIVIALGLLLVLLGAGWFTSRKVSGDREVARMSQQMDLEADLPAPAGAFRKDESAVAASTEQDVNDPEKQLLIRR